MATILQFYRNLSDREMERACMYDIEVKYALGLKLNERPFDHSSLGDFRKRLLENGKEKEIFDRILSHLVKQGLIEKDEIQRIDATHVIADIAIPTMVTLVKKGIYEILKSLKRRHEGTLKKVEGEIKLSEYTKEKINLEAPGRMDMEKKKKKLVEVVNDAHVVLKHVKGIKVDRNLKKGIELLKRILQENIEEDEEGNPKEKNYKEKPKDILVSLVDPDARYGAKSHTKRFTGYKASITETISSRFITSINATPGNRHDGETMIAAVTEQKPQGLVPSKVIGDAAYGNGTYRKDLKSEGTQVVAPLKEKNDRTKSVYSKNLFQYDQDKQTLTCPQGVITKASFYDRRKTGKNIPLPDEDV